MFAVFGDAVLTVIQVVPWALPAGIGMLLYSSTTTSVGGVIMLVYLIRILRPSTVSSRGLPIARAWRRLWRADSGRGVICAEYSRAGQIPHFSVASNALSFECRQSCRFSVPPQPIGSVPRTPGLRT